MKHLSLLCCSILMLGMLFACGQEEDPYLDNRYNVVMRKDGAKQVYAGTVTSLSACQYHSHRFKRKHGLDDKWEAVCCWKTEDSECKEEHVPKSIGFMAK